MFFLIIISAIVGIVFTVNFYTKKRKKESLKNAVEKFFLAKENIEFHNQKLGITNVVGDSLTVYFSFYTFEQNTLEKKLNARVYKIHHKNYGIREIEMYNNQGTSAIQSNRNIPDQW